MKKRFTSFYADKPYFSLGRGAGGSRTLVQTSSSSAFYMLSLPLIVGYGPVEDDLSVPYLLWFRCPPEVCGQLALFFDTP